MTAGTTDLDRELRRMAVLHARELAAQRRGGRAARPRQALGLVGRRLPNTAVPTRTIVAP